MSELQTKAILITGASRGIGRAIAKRLAPGGVHLLLHGRDRDALNSTDNEVSAAGGEATLVTADLATSDGVDDLINAVEGFEIITIINNAGIAVVKPVEDITLDDWHKTLNINVTAPFILINRLLPKMSMGSSIVNIMSIAARTGFPGWGAYCMSKFAIEGFSQSLRAELRPRGIRVINVYPSATKTEIWNGIAGNWPKDKMIDSNEVAEAVAYALNRPPSVLIESINVGDITGTL